MTRPELPGYERYRRSIASGAPLAVKLHAPGDIAEDRFGFAVHLALHPDGWLFVRNRERSCWELPGGRRDPGETIAQTGLRELAEETGRQALASRELLSYSVLLTGRRTYGKLFLAEVEGRCQPPQESEIGEVRPAWSIPEPLCYDHVQGLLLCMLHRWSARMPTPSSLLLSRHEDKLPTPATVRSLLGEPPSWRSG